MVGAHFDSWHSGTGATDNGAGSAVMIEVMRILTGGTDHLSFTRVGLPGFQFIQDSLDYETLTHHTSADTDDHAVPADLMQASAVIASVVYQAANRTERLPRRELPKGSPVKASGQAR